MPKLTIILQPTNRHEVVNGVDFRVFEGRTDSGIVLEMLGLFRITDPVKRAEFHNAVCVAAPNDPAPVRLLSENGLIRP